MYHLCLKVLKCIPTGCMCAGSFYQIQLKEGLFFFLTGKRNNFESFILLAEIMRVWGNLPPFGISWKVLWKCILHEQLGGFECKNGAKNGKDIWSFHCHAEVKNLIADDNPWPVEMRVTLPPQKKKTLITSLP